MRRRILIGAATKAAPAPQREFVDLGLPSGNLWAVENVTGGDYSYEENGFYYYKFANDNDIHIAENAVAQWAGNNTDVRLPTKDDYAELKDYTNVTFENNYIKFENKADSQKYIRIYLAGYNWLGTLSDFGTNGYTWTSDIYSQNDRTAYDFEYSEDSLTINSSSFASAFILRALKTSSTPSYRVIDLGLPSGTLWGNKNVGASSPSDVGFYFSWANIDGVTANNARDLTKNSYNDTWGANVSTDISPGNIYDAAHSNLSGKWVMPTIAQYTELFNNTTHEFTNQDNVNGLLLTSKINNETIFLPVTGYIDDGVLKDTNAGNYWSTTMSTVSSTEAFGILFSSGTMSLNHTYPRYCGCAIRPVCNPT